MREIIALDSLKVKTMRILRLSHSVGLDCQYRPTAILKGVY